MRRILALLLAALLPALLLLSSCGEEYDPVPSGEIRVHFLDVGQADCTLLRTHDTVILIDTGDAGSAEAILSYLDDLEIREIDCMVLTHPHDDHIGGASSILSELTVKECILPNLTVDSPTFHQLLEDLRRAGTRVSEGYAMKPLQYGDVSLEILWPEEYPQKEYGDNDSSIVLRAVFGANTVLFPGDVSSKVENVLVKTYEPELLKSQILKVGHHGARSSTNEAFLKAVAPRHAVVSCGSGNSYAYPHLDLLMRLNDVGIVVSRTDTDGTIVFRGNGEIFSRLE